MFRKGENILDRAPQFCLARFFERKSLGYFMGTAFTIATTTSFAKPMLKAIAEKAGAKLFFRSQKGNFILFQGDCRSVLHELNKASIEPDLIYADPPYHLSNGGISCQSGKMVSVNKGKWDTSDGPEADHAFVLSWIRSCLEALEKNGSIWISGTHHIIFSIGFGLQKLGAKILNTVVWEKTAPPPHLACRYYTHSHEFVLWARKSEKSKHVYNYAFEKEANGGKQQKDIWFPRHQDGDKEHLPNHWRLNAPKKAEKALGKHPTQKPLELLDRIIRCSSKPGSLVLDPFCGSGTTGIAALPLGRCFIGIDLSAEYLELAKLRHKALLQGDIF
jgi:site-specific DNA-methyltransferase (adenine-specific)